MSFFTKKNFLYKLIICICIFLALMNIGTPQKVYAKEPETGGALLKPIGELVLGLSDAIMNVLQKAVMGTNATLELDNTKRFDWKTAIIWLVVIAIAVAATIITAGGVWAAIGPMIVAAAKIAAIYGAICLATQGAAHTVVTSIMAESLNDTLVFPTYTIGPEEIFTGKILLFDANIFNPKEVKVEYNVVGGEDGKTIISTQTVPFKQWNEKDKFEEENQPKRFYYEKNGKIVETSVNNSAYELRNVISRWYYIIRTIALVGSMLILLYIGIRIIISSIAEEKAKYKQMLSDWVIALCLIFLMHYIMIFAHNIVDSITNLFGTLVNQGTHVATIVGPKDVLRDAVKDLETSQNVEAGYYYDETNNVIKIPTNLMGRMRVEAQNESGTTDYVGYIVAYLVLVIFTLTFSFTYIKRLLYLLFLTVIAPFVALTYPIDKIHDGKAQAFDMWLKEYIFNLLIQPFHLLLYTIFVSMAIELSSTNIIYTLVVLGFMMPAEKFLRTMFGFNKASTPGMLGGAAGAAMAMSAVNSLGKFAKGGHGGKDGGGNKDKEKDKNEKIRMPDSSHSQQQLFENVANENQQPNNSGNEPGGNGPGGNQNSLDEERNRLASERSVLEEFEAEGALSDNWSDEDYEAYQELEREQLEAEERLRQQEAANASDPEETANVSVPEPEEVAQPAPQTPEPSNNKPKKTRSAGRAIGRFVGRTALSAGKYTLKTGVNLAGKTALGLAGGMIGLAAGVASGDPSKAFQNTVAGAGTGAAVASGITNRVSSGIKNSVDSYNKEKEKFMQDYYGADYDEYKRKQQDNEFMKDKAIREMYKQKLGLDNKKDVDLAMKDALKYREYGINDNSTIIKAMKLDNGNSQNRADNRRIAAAKLAESSKSQKDLETNMKRFGKTKGITQAQVDDMERLVRKINNL